MHRTGRRALGKNENVKEQDPVSAGTVRVLTSRAGGSDVLHPLDKERAIRTIRALSLTDTPIDPVAIHTEALRSGWQPDAADRLREIAEKFADGRIVKGGKITKTDARKLVARICADDSAGSA